MTAKKTKNTNEAPKPVEPTEEEKARSIVVTMNDSGNASTNKVKTTRELYMESE